MFSEFPNAVYFVGIGGVSMSALALLLHERGVRVRGSDLKEGEYTRLLRERGISVHIGESEPVTENAVVYTGAATFSQPQLAAAKRAGKRLIPRAEILGRIAEEFPSVVSVAGCHGKTSTTSMLSHIFARAGRAFTCHIGGEDAAFGNYYSSGGDAFLTEACEFQRSFLFLKSSVAVILNTDLDHSDCYRTQEELTEAYAEFARRAEQVIVNADDLRARKIPHALSFGLHTGDLYASELCPDREKYAFTVMDRSVPLVRIKLNVPGIFQIYNALAAFAAARLCGISAEEARLGLEDFRGVKRRFERIGTFGGVPVVCDYAHHPREIAATLRTAEKLCRGTVRLVFQPHTYTRTRDFMKEFVEALKKAESPIVYKTFAARENFDFEGSAAALLARLPEARYAQTPSQLKKRLAENLRPDDLILVLGAGDIYDVANEITD
ncbi:MAG: UDP-N-acetylmuramate--L-alanine ligase [Candidatus Gallimonas sp.]